MVYAIKPTVAKHCIAIRPDLEEAIERDGRFRAVVALGTMRPDLAGVLSPVTVIIQNVRRVARADYCGQHPGQCNPFGRGHYKSKSLEWKDWIEFHAIVNDVLDAKNIEAEVWTNPREVMQPHTKKFWVRKGFYRRVRYDYEETFTEIGVPRQVWNSGTDDQFRMNP